MQGIVESRQNLKELLKKQENSILEALPRHLAQDPGYVKRMNKSIVMAASKNPKLFECTKLSWVRAVMTASELGLDPSGTLGSGYLIPFKGEVQFIPGYRGLIELARRSTSVVDIEARLIYDKDEVDLEYGLTPKLIHKPYLGANRGKIVAAYMVARLKDAPDKFELMTMEEIEQVRQSSKQPNGPVWTGPFKGEAYRKSVIRRAIKYLPLSIESGEALSKAVSTEDNVFGLTGLEDESSNVPQEGRISYANASYTEDKTKEEKEQEKPKEFLKPEKTEETKETEKPEKKPEEKAAEAKETKSDEEIIDVDGEDDEFDEELNF